MLFKKLKLKKLNIITILLLLLAAIFTFCFILNIENFFNVKENHMNIFINSDGEIEKISSKKKSNNPNSQKTGTNNNNNNNNNKKNEDENPLQSAINNFEAPEMPSSEEITGELSNLGDKIKDFDIPDIGF